MTRFNTLVCMALVMLAGSIALNVFTFVYTVTVCKGKDHCSVLGFEIERVR